MLFDIIYVPLFLLDYINVSSLGTFLLDLHSNFLRITSLQVVASIVKHVKKLKHLAIGQNTIVGL